MVASIILGRSTFAFTTFLDRSIRETEVWNLTESISSSQGVPINLSNKLLSLTDTSISRAAFGEMCKK
jgi:hypothetical protein